MRHIPMVMSMVVIVVDNDGVARWLYEIGNVKGGV